MLGIEPWQSVEGFLGGLPGRYKHPGIVRPPGQAAAANEVHHPDADGPQVENLTAVARSTAGVVGGAEKPGSALPCNSRPRFLFSHYFWELL